MGVAISQNLSEVSYDIGSNTSQVRYLVQATTSGSSYTNYNITTSYNIDGVGYTNTHKLPRNTTTTIVDRTVTITHNDDGQRSVGASYSCPTGISVGTLSGSTSIKLTTIPRYSVISSAPNFNDEENPTITFSNPSGGYFSLKAKIEAGGNTQLITRTLSNNATSCTFDLTDSERNTLRGLITSSNSLNVRFTICCMNGSSELSSSYLDRVMTITNGNPTFSTFTYKDTNTTVTAITGNNQVLVKGLSTLQATISASNKMVANKKATAKNYIATIDDINKSADYSTSDITLDLGSVSTSGTKRLNIRAYDSRNNSTLVYKDIVVYDYDKPVINATLTRLNNFENQTTLKVSGTYSKLTINNTNKNVVSTIQYRYRETNGTWSSWKTLTSTISDGKFTCTDVILSLDNTKSFEFQIQAIDKLQTTTNELSVDIGQAIFMIGSNTNACYINGQEILTYEVVDEW